jgi:excisionase family DNA binding protein
MDATIAELLTVSETAAALRLGERTVRGMIADGRLPVVRPAGLRVVRVPSAAVRRLLDLDSPRPARSGG